MTHLKICGLTRKEDIAACASLQVHAIGLNLCASSPRKLTLAQGVALAQNMPGNLALVWVVDGAPPAGFEDALMAFPKCMVQRCAPEWAWPDALAPARRIEVVRPKVAGDLAAARKRPEAILVCDTAHALALGGTGTTGDWTLAAALAKDRRMYLAGGLNAQNVAAAITAVKPYGVDVASGVESKPGIKDHQKLKEFMHAVREMRGTSS